MPKLSNIDVSLNLGLIQLSGTWKPDEAERNAAWEMYVELVTRVALQEMKEDAGLLREALESLYSLFESTRAILRKYGSSIAKPIDGPLSFGYFAVAILNEVLRPFLTKWHPMLQDYEDSKPDTVSRLEHEAKWEYNKELRAELNNIRGMLKSYADLLSEAADVSPLHEIETEPVNDS